MRRKVFGGRTPLALGCVIASAAATGYGALSNGQIEEIDIQANGQYYINDVGNGRFRVTYSFSPPRAYDRVKRNFPNLYVLFRDLSVNRGSLEVIRPSLNVTANDSDRTITFVGDIMGVVDNRANKWYLPLPKEEKIVTRVGNRIFTTSAVRGENNTLLSGKYEYILPGRAKVDEYAPDKQLLSYALDIPRVKGKPELDTHLRVKNRIMSALHKIHADPEMDNGRHWVGKLLLKNTGKVPIYDVMVTFRLGEYSDTSVPQRFDVVAPGGAAVAPYYPVIFSKVAQLRSRTPTELRVTLEYKDAEGKAYRDEFGRKLDIAGINQFEYSNLSDDERTDSWFDHFNNAELLAAFVNKGDEAVRQFAGIVSDAAGGVASAESSEKALRWLKQAYEQMQKNGIVYQSPNGFMTVEQSTGQDLKYPRDVFREKSGTCIDLAITYAALADAVGLRPHLVLMPGHCFAMVELPGGEILKVENTGVGAEKRLSFEEALKRGEQAYATAAQDGRLIVVNVRKALEQGRVSPPELPPLPADFLSKLGIRKR